MKNLSPILQEDFNLIKAQYKKTEISKGDIYIFDGSILHVIEEKNDKIKISSTINTRYWVLLSLLIIFGILLGIIGVLLVIITAKIALIKCKKDKKAKVIALLSKNAKDTTNN